ncbi:hypothetical protein ACHAWF_007342 [Thalassiosira exigua]
MTAAKTCSSGRAALHILFVFTLHHLRAPFVNATTIGKFAPSFVVLPESITVSLVRRRLRLRNHRNQQLDRFQCLQALGGERPLDEFQKEDQFSRRELLRSISAMGAATLIGPSSALAVAETVSKKSALPSASSMALCDPSVSTWVKNDATRTVHILGTAHISSSSAELAGQLVRELKPDVVFVELDAKRVARVIPDAGAGGKNFSSKEGASSNGDGASFSLPPKMNGDGPQGKNTAFTGSSSAANDDSTAERSNPLVNVGSRYVGNAVKSMYGKLESEGFKAGDEFAVGVREGLAAGSTIVLGDRDVEVTLRRLTRALTKTDIRKLLSADSEVNTSMEELLPEGMKNQLAKSSGGSVTSLGIEDVTVDKGEFRTFVENMKARENVRSIMGALRSAAPEIYEAMVAERDIYMARGLDELGDNVKGSSKQTVAVMGMAHVDGVEHYLYGKGWRKMTYPCP